MQNLIIDIMNHYGYIGVIFLIAAENIFPPIPSEVILTFGGFLTTCTRLDVWFVILAATAGSIFGAVVLYGVGYVVKPEMLANILSGRTGKILRLKPEDVYHAQEWFNSKGNLTVFFCRFIPIIRSLISIPAGMAKMNMGKFMAMTLSGTLIWNIVLVWLGRFAGESWGKVAAYMDTYSEVGKAVIIVGIIASVVVFYYKRQKKKRQPGL